MNAASRFPLKSCHVAKVMRQMVNSIKARAENLFM